MKILDGWLLLFLTACAGLGSTSSSSSTEPRASGADSSGSVTIPDVFMLPRDQAIATLRRAGVQGDITDDGTLCGSIVDGRIVETGQVCSQRPTAGQTQGARLSVTLTIQTEDPRHGDVGLPTEWRLMPNLVGLTFEQALAEMRRTGFVEDDRLQHIWADETSCKPGVVCRQYPEPSLRAGLHDGKAVYVGQDRAAPPLSARAAPPTPSVAAPSPSPPPTPPSSTTGPVKHWGGDGSPAYRDADHRPHGPGGGVYMGTSEPCTDKHDHCMRAGVRFASDGAVAGKLFRATPVFELEDKWWTWRGEPATHTHLFATKIPDKIADVAVGKPIVFLTQESANEQWVDNEYDALTTSRWSVGVVEAVEKDTVRVLGWGAVPLAYVRIVLDDKSN